MHTINEIFIDASPGQVYELAAHIEEWPRLLAHYRYVEILHPGVGGDRRSRLVKMGAARSHLPVSWTALQHLDPRRRQVRYRHVGGATLGMDVVWTLVPERRGTHVTIEHDLLSPRRWLAPAPISHLIGSFFVESIADMTLAGIKKRAEAGG